MIIGFAKVENKYLYILGLHFIYTCRKNFNISFTRNPFYNKMFFFGYMYLKDNLQIINFICNFFLMISDCISFLQKNFMIRVRFSLYFLAKCFPDFQILFNPSKKFVMIFQTILNLLNYFMQHLQTCYYTRKMDLSMTTCIDFSKSCLFFQLHKP
jgi:hypothetical protein